MSKDYKMRLLTRLLLFTIATFHSQTDGLKKSDGMKKTDVYQRRRIKTPKCRYTFIVNELDGTACPSTLAQLQADRNPGAPASPYNQPYNLPAAAAAANTSIEVKSLLNNIEQKLHDELRKSNDINSTLSKHEVSLSRAEKLLSAYETNFTAVFRMLSFLERTMQEQNDLSQHLDKKLSAVMLDVVEVNNVLSKKVSVVNGKVQDKDIEVRSASKINGCPETQKAVTYRDCAEVQRRHNASGVYYILPTYAPCPMPVWCDMDTTKGGWLVLIRRQNGKVSFKRLWNDYKLGFGNIAGEFYLGNDNIFLLTNQKHYEVRIDLWDFDGNRVFAVYRTFKIDGERDKYRLSVHSYEGSARDALQKHDRMMFSTPDNDNDGYKGYNCAQEWEAGWWFNNCWFGFLTGHYYNESKVRYRGISWNDWKHEQLAKVEMKIRPSRSAPENNDLV